MSKLTYRVNLNEVQVDKDGNYIKSFETNLPHFKELAEEFCNQWNKENMGQFFDGPVKDAIKTSKACICKVLPDGRCNVDIVTNFIDGFRLSEKRRNSFWEQMEAQMCDGWGEGIFGPINTLELRDGTFAYID